MVTTKCRLDLRSCKPTDSSFLKDWKGDCLKSLFFSRARDTFHTVMTRNKKFWSMLLFTFYWETINFPTLSFRVFHKLLLTWLVNDVEISEIYCEPFSFKNAKGQSPLWDTDYSFIPFLLWMQNSEMVKVYILALLHTVIIFKYWLLFQQQAVRTTYARWNICFTSNDRGYCTSRFMVFVL